MNGRTPVLIALAVSLALLCCGWQVGDSFAAENRGHAAPANLLPKELKDIAVRDNFIPSTKKAAGVIQSVIAHVVVARGDLRQAYYAADGDRLFEQDVVFTLKDSKCRIKLLNDDIITMGDNSRLAVTEMTGDRKTPEKKSVLALARGKAMFYAIRLFNHKSATMNVVSPTAVTGVRGTKFGIEVTVANEKAAVARPLLLADASADWARHLILAQGAPPPGVTTVVHGFEGTVAVTSTVDGRTQTVGAGQTVSTTPQGIGALIPTPPQVSQSFQAATNVPPPQGAGGTGGAGGGQTQGGAGGTGGTTSTSTTSTTTTTTTTTADASTPPVVDTSNVTQTQSTTQTEQAATQVDPVTDPKTNASGGHTGYFAGILTNLSTAGVQDVYVSRNRYDGDASVWGRGLLNSLDYLRVEGGGKFGNPTLKWAELFG
ncbi:MAG: FecR domain-containing protein, partial [Syntrophales bacterium]|nr:FecR domain-containing protein [Syntrophales bacterium]